MNGIRHQIHLLGLFVLGAAIPLAGVALLLAAGLLMFTSITGLVLGAFLLSNGIYGLVMGFRSFPMPTGRKLDAGNAPALLEKLGELGEAWKGERPREVLMDPGFWTLDLVGVPTLGLLGWPRFKWLLGVYPMLALGGREFETIASWELVWWSDQQGWMNLQVKRLAAYWSRLHASFQQDGPSRSPLKERWSRAFLKPYAKWVNRRLEPFLVGELMRTDAIIAGQFGAATLVRALCRLALLKPLLECRLFAEWDLRLKRGEDLPEHPYGAIADLLARWPEGAEALLDLALDGLVPEAPPLLKARLEHLDEAAIVPLPAGGTRASRLMEEGGVLEDLERHWSQRLREMVAEARQGRQAQASRYLELRPIEATGFPRSYDSREYLQVASHCAPAEAFAALASRYLEAHPSDGDARMLALRARLRVDEAAARGELEGMTRENPFLGPARCELLGELAREQGRIREAERMWVEGRRVEVEAQRAREERRGVSLKDAFDPHGCSEAEVRALRESLEGDPRVREAFLVRKRVAFFPQHPVLLLVVRWRRPFWDLRDRKRSRFQMELVSRCPFPAHHSGFVLVTTRGHLRRARPRLTQVGGQIL